jgi:acetolactate synthase-1/2/3 large subunit
MGIGATLAAGRRKVVAMCGDGGFLLNLGELWTAVQENADIVLLVMNDGGYGIIRKIQDAFYGGRHHYDKLAAPDFGDLARTAGLPHWRIGSIAEVDDAMTAALAVPGPALVEVDMTALGPFPDAALPPQIRPRAADQESSPTP